MVNKNKAKVNWLFIILFLTSGIAIFANNASFGDTSSNRLAEAQKKWNAQNVSHYRLTLHYSSFHDNCQQEVEIKDEKVIAVKQNTCPTIPAQTITELFEQIESSADGTKCGPNGCACDGPVDVNATYDAQYGYPLQLEMELAPNKRWLYLDYWRNQVQGLPCTMIGFINQKITISKFTPISN
ncbi:MAG: DUF6174 domain-containing protein [Aulosira sp. DedQUE10]|nr:DUF6174 domain-containing protein [Aulosira sp. DedQUE10]